VDELRKQAKQALDDAPLQSFWQIVNEAKIADEHKEVLDLKFIRGRSNVQISLELGMSLEKVNKIIRKSYEKVGKLINIR